MASEAMFLLVGVVLILIAGSARGAYGNMMLPLLGLGVFSVLGAIGFLPLMSETSLIIVFMLAFGLIAVAKIKTVSLTAAAIKFGVVFYVIMALVRGI